jgi:hypothetical protein
MSEQWIQHITTAAGRSGSSYTKASHSQSSGMSESVDYERLKSNTGIDFEGLRQKYKNIKKSSAVMTQQNGSDEEEEERRRNEKEKLERQREENENAMKKLNEYKICQMCNGQGIIKETYNFYQIDKTCPECDGESVMSVDLKTLIEP